MRRLAILVISVVLVMTPMAAGWASSSPPQPTGAAAGSVTRAPHPASTSDPTRDVAMIVVAVLGLWIATIVSRGKGERPFTLYSGTPPNNG